MRTALALAVFCCAVASFLTPLVAAAQDGAELARKAAKALAGSQLTEALKYYTEALADEKLSNDRRGVILADRGVVYARLNQPDRAIADFNRAVTLFPEYAAVYNNRGAFLVALGAIDEGIKDFDRAIVLAPGYVAAWNNRAAAHAKEGRLEAAIADYTRAISISSALAEPLVGRAKVYLSQGRAYTALRDLSRAIANDPRFAQGYRIRAEARMSLDQHAEAAEDLSRAIAFNPQDAQAYLLRGRAYFKSRNLEAALKDFTKAAEIDPQSAESYRERGNINILRDDFEQAEQDLARAIEIEPRNPVTLAYRALMYKKRDQPELGAQEIAKALKVGQDNAVVQWAKGELEEARQMMVEAAQSYRKALAIDPELAMAQLGLRRLGQEVPENSIRVGGKDVGGWQIERDNARYYATSETYSGLRIPLELAGRGQPRLLSWEEKEAPLKGIALLKFSAGTVSVEGGKDESVEYVALVDLRTEKLISIEPHKRGNRESQWTWQDGTVTVAAIDGLTTVHELRRVVKPAAIAAAPIGGERRERRRSRTTFDSQGTPNWAPWADHTTRTRPRVSARTRSRDSRRRRPKTLFDMILGN